MWRIPNPWKNNWKMLHIKEGGDSNNTWSRLNLNGEHRHQEFQRFPYCWCGWNVRKPYFSGISTNTSKKNRVCELLGINTFFWKQTVESLTFSKRKWTSWLVQTVWKSKDSKSLSNATWAIWIKDSKNFRIRQVTRA